MRWLTPLLLALLCSSLCLGAEAPGKYEVKTGDTLSSIARQELGDASLWREIARLNDLDESGAVREGQILLMPAGGSRAATRFRANPLPDAPATAAARPAPLPESAATPMLSGASADLGIDAFWGLLVAAAAAWLFFTASLRGACWFALVEASLLRCAILAFWLTLLTAGVVATLAAAGIGAAIRSSSLPPGSAALIMLGLVVLYLLAGVWLTRWILDCKWRSVLTVHVMSTVVANLLLAGLWFAVAAAESAGRIPPEYRAQIKTLAAKAQQAGKEAGVPCSSAARSDE
jgi:hypothetical protein